MPSIHIPEETWGTLLVANDGNAREAREDVKEAAKAKAEEYE